MFANRFTLPWTYWAITDLLLIIGVTVEPLALKLAIILNIIQVIHFYSMTPHISNFAVQVRIGYLLLLVIALYPPLHFIFFLQIIGTTAMVALNYCFLARFMSLMPWNNTRQYTFELISQTFFSKPVDGSVQQPKAK